MLRWWNSGNPRNTAGLVNKESRGGGRERYGGRQSPPKIHAGPGAFFPRCDPCPPQSGRLQHLSIPLQDPAQYSPFHQEVASGSGSQTGRGGSKGGDVCAVGGGVGASLQCRTVSSRAGSREQQGNQVTAESGGETRWGWRAPSLK